MYCAGAANIIGVVADTTDRGEEAAARGIAGGRAAGGIAKATGGTAGVMVAVCETIGLVMTVLAAPTGVGVTTATGDTALPTPTAIGVGTTALETVKGMLLPLALLSADRIERVRLRSLLRSLLRERFRRLSRL